jgi:hypothetical protein
MPKSESSASLSPDRGVEPVAAAEDMELVAEVKVDQQRLEFLLKGAVSSRPVSQLFAAKALSELHVKEAKDALLGLAGHEAWQIRRQVAASLVPWLKEQDQDVVKALGALFEDEDVLVRWEAFRSLQQYPGTLSTGEGVFRDLTPPLRHQGYPFAMDEDKVWKAIGRGEAEPNEDQKMVMDKVTEALGQGLHYESAVRDFVLKALPDWLFSEKDKTRQEELGTRVEGGMVGGVIYDARYALEAIKDREARLEAVKKFCVGNIFRDKDVPGHTFSKMNVVALDSKGFVSLSCTKRGSSKHWEMTMDAGELLALVGVTPTPARTEGTKVYSFTDPARELNFRWWHDRGTDLWWATRHDKAGTQVGEAWNAANRLELEWQLAHADDPNNQDMVRQRFQP